MRTRDGYALDLLSPIRHVATEMERAGSQGPAPSVEAMASTYSHVIVGDLSRIRQSEPGVGNDYQAKLWLIQQAVTELGKHAVADGDGFRLVTPIGKLKYQGRLVRREDRTEDPDDVRRALRAAHQGLADDREFYVLVAGARGSTKSAVLRLHPVARLLPQIPLKEFLELAADMKAHGIHTPVRVQDGRVIDGRHRVAIAGALRIPVRVEEFTGSEEDMRTLVGSLNLHRRHLTSAQRALIVQELYLPAAEAEAKERLREGGTSAGRGRPKDPDSLVPTGAKLSESVGGTRATQIAAHRSGGLAQARALERMQPVRKAPKTRERIWKGEIKTATKAREEALKETGGGEPRELAFESANSEVGSALARIRGACEAVERGNRGNVTDDKLLARIAELHDLLDRLTELIK